MTDAAVLPVGAPSGAAPQPALSTFLFTDIAGSTRLWEDHATAMGAALGLHDRILRDAIAGEGGRIVKTTGDGMLAVFDDPARAVAAAIAAQRALGDTAWGETGPLRVRMAIHAGTAEERDGDYFGPALNRVARILAIGHGGQILTSAVCVVLANERLGPGVELLDLGSHRLRDLDRPEQVFQVTVDDLPRTFPPLRSLSTRRTNLPIQLTSFVGRETELGELEALLGRHRLVTLIGTGGTGKTRLMIEVAGRLAERFADGAWLAELAPLGDPSQVASEVARALGISEIPGQPAIETVSAFLADKELLLLLDNAEHLVDGVAEVAEQLLAVAPLLRILTTSREALAVPGEAILQLRSLSCPKIGSAFGQEEVVGVAEAAATEAVQLFTERASTVDPSFVLTAANVGSVVEICRRLDGIPLAIELAAARASAMTPDDIATRLGDRFRLLAGGRRTAVPRQQTLHALIDWSWDLLTEADRRLLRRLSIFAGGWTAGAAARIVGDGPEPEDEVELLDELQRLVDRSLVIVDRGPTTRYRMLETIRQYARERLIAAGEVDTVAARHLAAFETLALTAEPNLRGPLMIDWLDRMDADVENLGAALEWSIEAEPWQAVRLATAMLAYWTVRVASTDSDRRLAAAIEIARARVLGNPDATPEEQSQAARLLGEAGRIAAMGGRAQQGLAWARDASVLAEASGDPNARLQAVGGMVVSEVFTGGKDVRRLFDEGIDLASQTGTWWMLAVASGFAGAVIAHEDPAAAEVLIDEAEDAARRTGSPSIIGYVAIAHGRLYSVTKQTDAAAERYAVAIARFSEVGDERMTLASRSDLAHALRRGGRAAEAMTAYRETIEGWVRFGHRGAVANQIENVAYLAIDAGDHERGVRLLGAADAIREAADASRAVDEEPEQAAYLERAKGGLYERRFAEAWSAGRGMSQPDAVALATGG